MIKVTRTETTLTLNGSEQFVWEKRNGKHTGREFVCEQVKLTVYTGDEARSPEVDLTGTWLTPPANAEGHERRGWNYLYASSDQAAIRELPLAVRIALVDAGLVMPESPARAAQHAQP